MLTNARHLKDLSVHATDGELGVVKEFYFDDETWGVRYLIVETGGWLEGRQVLISPVSVRQVDWEQKRLEVTLTKKQVEDSPSIDTHQPILRQHEAEYLGYYGYPYYWGDPSVWGPAFLPTPSAGAVTVSTGDSTDSHLRSGDGVAGYGIATLDGEIGHLDGFVLEDSVWGIRYIEVATRNWWPGKKVLISPAWVERVSWPESTIYVGLTRDAIAGAPEYTESMTITREYENNLHLHYGQVPYWPHKAGA